MTLKGANQEVTAVESAMFLRNVMAEVKDSEIRAQLLNAIRENLKEVAPSPKVLKILIWCLGEFSSTESEAKKTLDLILESVGGLPFEQKPSQDKKDGETTHEEKKTITKTVILEDGSYGTETVVLSSGNIKDFQNKVIYPLRKCLMEKNFLLGSCLALNMTKLVIQLKKDLSPHYRKATIDSLLTLTSFLKLHQEDKEFDPDN